MGLSDFLVQNVFSRFRAGQLEFQLKLLTASPMAGLPRDNLQSKDQDPSSRLAVS